MKRSLQELLALKKKQIQEHNNIKPIAKPKPSEQLSDEQKQAADSLEEIAIKLKNLEEETTADISAEANVASKSKAIQAVRERLRTLEKQFRQFQDDTVKDLEVLGVGLHELATLNLHHSVLDELSVKITLEQQTLLDKINQAELGEKALHGQQLELKTKLNEPQLLYQQSLQALESWEEKLRELTGNPEEPDTLKGMENRIAQLDGLPVLLKEKQNRHQILSGEIFDILNAQRKAR